MRIYSLWNTETLRSCSHLDYPQTTLLSFYGMLYIDGLNYEYLFKQFGHNLILKQCNSGMKRPNLGMQITRMLKSSMLNDVTYLY